MSESIGTIISSVRSTPIEAPKARVADQVKTAPAAQESFDPASIVTLGQSEGLGLYDNSGAVEKYSSSAMPNNANTNLSFNAPETQLAIQNQTQQKNYSVIQHSLTAAANESDRSGTLISLLA